MEPQLNIKELYSCRMFLFIEEAPQANRYKRVLFTREQYKSISLKLKELFSQEKHNCDIPDCDGIELEVADETVVLPDVEDVHNCTKKCDC